MRDVARRQGDIAVTQLVLRRREQGQGCPAERGSSTPRCEDRGCSRVQGREDWVIPSRTGHGQKINHRDSLPTSLCRKAGEGLVVGVSPPWLRHTHQQHLKG